MSENRILAVVAAAVIALLLVQGCGPLSSGHAVEYKVTGSAATVSITFNIPVDSVAQARDVSLPWTYSFEGYSQEYLRLSAQTDAGGGTATTTILLNRAQWRSATASGSLATATVDGDLP